jgi:hypothetical protein
MLVLAGQSGSLGRNATFLEPPILQSQHRSMVIDSFDQKRPLYCIAVSHTSRCRGQGSDPVETRRGVVLKKAVVRSP